MGREDRPLTGAMHADGRPLSIAEYESSGGYRALRKAVSTMSPQDVQDVVTKSGLRGRGGAGFPTGAKWGFVPMTGDVRRPKYLCVNADEMEPGTFKDRLLLEHNPHLVLEGAGLAAYAIGADVAYVYIRREYRLAARRLRDALAEAHAAGFLGKNMMGSGYSLQMHLHVSSGRYMCGEEDGLIDALEGKRAIPRSKPPYPQTCGLWGKPTVVNNVETLCCIPGILANGPDWFKGLSLTADPGTKLFGVSGRVKRPGLWELPMGTPLREIIEEHAGGMAEGYHLRGLLPGGASTSYLTAEQLDVNMDFDSLVKAGSRLGTGTSVVLDDRTCPVGMVHNLTKFFARESCGWCTPCRDGLPWAEKILRALEAGEGRADDLDTLEELCWMMAPGHTFCALAPGAADPIKSALAHFRGDFERHVAEKRCPWRRP